MRPPSFSVALLGLLAALLMSGCGTDASTSASSAPSALDTTASEPPSPEPTDSSPPSTDASIAPADDDRTLAEKLDDARLEARVKQALIQKQRLRAFDLQPRAERERVTLRGDVNTVDQYETAGRTARRVEGVGAVANELTVDGRPVADRRPQAAPGSGAPKNGGGDGAVYHMVRTGDTLWNIANQYGTSVQRIQVLNDLHPDALRPGQRIRVR